MGYTPEQQYRRRRQKRAQYQKHRAANNAKCRDYWHERYAPGGAAFYKRRVLETGGRCEACGQVPETKKRLALDHCHTTNGLRGVLCHHCNAALGHLGDCGSVIARLDALRAYVLRTGCDKHENTQAASAEPERQLTLLTAG